MFKLVIDVDKYIDAPLQLLLKTHNSNVEQKTCKTGHLMQDQFSL